MKILGIITARGGSKRLPGKNIKDFLGKPLLAWSIETGKKSKVFDRFVLTTEDEKIAAVGKECGIEVPFMRPEKFAEDTSKSYDAIKHAYEWLRDQNGYNPDYIILLEPTAPGRQAFHIQEVAKIMQKEKVDSLMGITELPGHYHPLKLMELQNDNMIIKYHEGKLQRESEIRNQDLSTLYFTNSAIYAFKPQNFYNENPSLWGDRVHGYLMDEKYAFDIDTKEDWNHAEQKMKLLLEEKD